MLLKILWLEFTDFNFDPTEGVQIPYFFLCYLKAGKWLEWLENSVVDTFWYFSFHFSKILWKYQLWFLKEGTKSIYLGYFGYSRAVEWLEWYEFWTVEKFQYYLDRFRGPIVPIWFIQIEIKILFFYRQGFCASKHEWDFQFLRQI